MSKLVSTIVFCLFGIILFLTISSEAQRNVRTGEVYAFGVDTSLGQVRNVLLTNKKLFVIFLIQYYSIANLMDQYVVYPMDMAVADMVSELSITFFNNY